MIFSDVELVKKILDGTKTTTIRLKKDGEVLCAPHTLNPFYYVNIIKKNFNRMKWCVSANYAVSLGRGKKGIWFCKHCNKIHDSKCLCSCGRFPFDHYVSIPLRLVITQIEERDLLSITESECVQDGFKSKDDFLEYFYEVNKYSATGKKSILADADIKISEYKGWNPKVWKFGLKVL